MQVNKNQVLSLLSILGFVLLTRTAFLLYSVEPAGYVTDIYSMFPMNFYLGLAVCYLIASFLVLNGRVLIGSLVLCMNHLQVLLIPYMLKYYSMGRADDMTYIGEYLQIANSGHIASWDIYPASHIIGSGISIILNIEPHLVSFIVPIVFSFMFIAGIYLFSRKLFPGTYIKLLVVVSSFILYLGVYNYLNVPNALFFAFMPFYLYVINSYIEIKQNNRLSFSLIFILITIVLPYSHPFIVFFAIMTLLFYLLSNYVLPIKAQEFKIPQIRLNSFMILMISFLSWFFYQGRLLTDLSRLINSYLNQIGRDPTAVWTAEKVSQINFNFIDYLQLLTFFYGRYIIPTVFVLVSLIIIYHNKKILSDKYFKNYPYLLIMYVVFLFIQLIFLFNPIIVHQPDRIMNLNFVVFAQIPLFAIALYVIFLYRYKSIYNILLVCLILTSIWTISFFGAFDSQTVYRPNVALTYNEVKGMSWLSDSRGDYPLNMMFEQSYRYPDILGFERSNWIYIKTIPDHFGYDSDIDKFSDVYFGSSFNDYHCGYLVITSYGELLYQELPAHKKVGRFNKEDFEMIRDDVSVDKVYDSINLEILFVNNI
jgi:hypothetical protein